MTNADSEPSQKEVDDAFCAAIELQGVDQRNFLETLPTLLRTRVDSLLRSYYDAGTAFLSPAVAGEALIESGSEIDADEIPGCRIIGLLGAGGMGRVYLAEQPAPLSRKVAIKVINSNSLGTSLPDRFRTEQASNALMDHPNIARVLDAGISSSGNAYLMMEFIDGCSITEFCDNEAMAIPDRLQLFEQLCRAIQHAHQKGIIHRDIKPSNVLVTVIEEKPVVKVIDFGLAKSVLPVQEPGRSDLTLFGQVLGTLRYMSPEQVSSISLDVDTRSDVYSLGVLLYELLTSTTPITRERTKSDSTETLLTAIRDEQVERPSVRLARLNDASVGKNRGTSLSALQLCLQAELDWIVLRALEKDRTDRYDSASGFANDIVRYLRHEVVEATPPSAAYRIRKFIQRHKIGVATTAVFAVLLITSVIVASVLAFWAMDEAVRAQAAERAAREAELATRQARDLAEKNAAELSQVVYLGFSVLEARYVADTDQVFSVVKSLREMPQLQNSSAGIEARANVFRAAFSLIELQQLANDRKPFAADAIKLFDEAKALLNKAIELDPQLGFAYLARAQLQSETYSLFESARVLLGAMGRPLPTPNEILADWHEAVRLMPKSTYAYSGRGWWRMRLGETEAASADFLMAIRLNPDNDFAHQGLGTLKESMGEHQQSVESYLRAFRSPVRLGDVLFRSVSRSNIAHEIATITFNSLWDKDAAPILQIYPAAVVHVFGAKNPQMQFADGIVWDKAIQCLAGDSKVEASDLVLALNSINFSEGDVAFRANRDLLAASVAVANMSANVREVDRLLEQSFPAGMTAWRGTLNMAQLTSVRSYLVRSNAEGSAIVLKVLDRIQSPDAGQ